MLSIRRIGVLTSGGDAPGMNACVRAVVRTAIAHDLQVRGIRRGFEGLVEGDFVEMDGRSVSNIVQTGGTILKSARCPRFREEEGRAEAARQIEEAQIDALVAIGGDGTFNGAQRFNAEHDVPIIGCPGTIDNDLFGTDETIGYDSALNTAIENIESAFERMETLVEDLLVVSREGWTVETRQRVDGARLVADAWAAVATAEATLECEWAGTVEADPDRLAQAFENLFRNAVDHAGPSVTVRVGPLDDTAGVYVADDGPGIPADERDTVFEMGVSDDGGTGLGLAIVERIVTAHGWSISAGGSEGGGARFEIRFDGEPA